MSKEILSRILIAYGIEEKRGWQALLAKMISEPANLVSMWKSSRDIPERIISNVALETGYLKEWLETGNGPMRTITADAVNHDSQNRIREGPWKATGHSIPPPNVDAMAPKTP